MAATNADVYKQFLKDYGTAAIADARINSDLRDLVRTAIRNKEQVVSIHEIASILNMRLK